MPAVRKVLGLCTVETAIRKRICHRDRSGHNIERNTVCLVIKDPMNGGSKNYCPEHALEILEQAANDLKKLRAALSSCV
jgi:hypothetical protein